MPSASDHARVATSTTPGRRAPLGFAAAVVAATTVSFVGTALAVVIGASMSGAGAATPPVVAHVGPTLDQVQVRALALAGTLGVAGQSCGQTLRGSGFLADGKLWTNAHLVRGGGLVKVDQAVAPTVVPLHGVSSEIDLAIADAVPGVTFELAPENPEIGEQVTVAGHEHGGTTVLRSGAVHLYANGDSYGVGGTVMLIDVETAPGFSGGPVLNADGQVVAMLQGFSEPLGLTLAIPVDDLRYWGESVSTATVEDCNEA